MVFGEEETFFLPKYHVCVQESVEVSLYQGCPYGGVPMYMQTPLVTVHVMMCRISELERKLQEDRAEAEEKLEAQRVEYENRLGELEVELVKKKREVRRDIIWVCVCMCI